MKGAPAGIRTRVMASTGPHDWPHQSCDWQLSPYTTGAHSKVFSTYLIMFSYFQSRNSCKEAKVIKRLAASRVSPELAHQSTARIAGGLYFRVRNESGCCPAAMAASQEL